MAPIPPLTVRAKPDFHLVGHPKCGTSALSTMLASHPDIHMAAVRESKFFATDVFPATRTLEEYLALFTGASPTQVVGETDIENLSSRVAAQAIAEHNPRARIVAIFREPASFLHSLHLQYLRKDTERPRDLGSALPLYTDRVRYTEQLERYRAVFPDSQILVLVYEDFRDDNPGTLRRLLEFLQVDPATPIAPVEANPSVKIRHRTKRMLISVAQGSNPVTRPLKRVVTTVTSQSTRRAAYWACQRSLVRATAPAADERLAAELRHTLRSEVVRFGELIDRDLIARWNY